MQKIIITLQANTDSIRSKNNHEIGLGPFVKFET